MMKLFVRPESLMSRLRLIIFAFLLLQWYGNAEAQAPTRSEKAGHAYRVALADYMQRTVGINASASIEFYNDEIGMAGFIIDDVKDDLSRAEVTFDNVQVYFETFLLDFTDGLDSADVGLMESQSLDGRNFRFVDVTIPDAETGENIIYFTAVAETNKCYYKVLIWSDSKQYPLIRQDFINLLLSIQEQG